MKPTTESQAAVHEVPEAVQRATERLRQGFNYANCPDEWGECNDARTIAEHYLAQQASAVEHRSFSPHEYGQAGACGCASCMEQKIGVLRHDLAAAKGEVEEAATLNNEMKTLVYQACDERDSARNLLRRIRGWDHMDAAADGPYWRAEIDALLGPEQPDPETLPMLLDPTQWPMVDGGGQEVECDHIMGCQPISSARARSAFEVQSSPSPSEQRQDASRPEQKVSPQASQG